jgi:hypothetical protein
MSSLHINAISSQIQFFLSQLTWYIESRTVNERSDLRKGTASFLILPRALSSNSQLDAPQYVTPGVPPATATVLVLSVLSDLIPFSAFASVLIVLSNFAVSAAS